MQGNDALGKLSPAKPHLTNCSISQPVCRASLKFGLLRHKYATHTPVPLSQTTTFCLDVVMPTIANSRRNQHQAVGFGPGLRSRHLLLDQPVI